MFMQNCKDIQNKGKRINEVNKIYGNKNKEDYTTNDLNDILMLIFDKLF